MSPRFPTEAANDPDKRRQGQETPPPIGTEGTPRSRADGTLDPYERPRSGDTRPRRRLREDDAKPGKDSDKS